MIIKLTKNRIEAQNCIFDFDGVITDSEKYHFRSWVIAFKMVGIDLTYDDYRPLQSTGGPFIINSIAKSFGLDLDQNTKDKILAKKRESYNIIASEIGEKDLLPGLRQFIIALYEHGIKLALASSAITAKRLLKQLDLDKYFSVFLDGNDNLPKKPAPDIFLKSAKLLNADIKDCLVFEDSKAGLEAAKNGGFNSIAVGPQNKGFQNQIDDYLNFENWIEF